MCRRSCAVLPFTLRAARMVQDALFFAPKLYIGTASGQKKGKATQKPTEFDTPSAFNTL